MAAAAHGSPSHHWHVEVKLSEALAVHGSSSPYRHNEVTTEVATVASGSPHLSITKFPMTPIDLKLLVVLVSWEV